MHTNIDTEHVLLVHESCRQRRQIACFQHEAQECEDALWKGLMRLQVSLPHVATQHSRGNCKHTY